MLRPKPYACRVFSASPKPKSTPLATGGFKRATWRDGLPERTRTAHIPFRPPASDPHTLAIRQWAEFSLPCHPLSAAADSYGRVRRACEEEGRSPDDLVYSAALTVCCGKDGAEVGRRAARIGRDPERIDAAGTPAQVVDRLKGWAEAGAGRIYLQVLDLDDLDHIRLLGAEVLPHV